MNMDSQLIIFIWDFFREGKEQKSTLTLRDFYILQTLKIIFICDTVTCKCINSGDDMQHVANMTKQHS